MDTRGVCCCLIILLFAFTSSCYARPEPTASQLESNVTQDETLECNSCRDVVGFTRRLFDTSDIDELKTNLTKWCVESGNGATDQVCRSYIDEGIKALDRVGSSFLCERVHVCPEGSIPPLTASQEIGDGTKCDFCINVVTSVKQIVASSETEREFKECLGNACVHIGALKDECMELVDKNLDSLFKYLRERMNPRQVCKSTGYCAHSDNSTSEVASVAGPNDGIINLGPVEVVESELIDETVTTDDHQLEIVPFAKMQPAQSVGKPDPVKCLMCKHIVSDVLKKIKDNKTEQMIIDRLDGVCTRILPEGKQVQQCEKFVQEYTEQIVALIVQENDPKKICRLLNVCAQKKQPSPDDDDAFCDECQVASDWIFGEIHNSTALPDAIDSVCAKALPFESKEYCEQFIQEKKSTLEQSFRLHNDSLALCKHVALCTSSPVNTGDETERETLATASPYPSCFICKKIVQWIHNEIRGNKSEAVIEDALKRVCKHMKHVQECDTKVEIWSRQIVTALKIGTDPNVLCLTLGECGSAANGADEAAENEIESFERTESKTERSVETVTEMTGNGACYECQMIAHFIQQELYDFGEEKRIEDFVVSNVCRRVKDETVKETCVSFVTQYGPSVLQLISQKQFDPRILCQDELHICPQSSTPSAATVEPKLDIELTNSSGRNQLCSICEESVRQLDSVLSSISASEKQAETVVSQVCSHFTDDKKQQCEKIIEAFGAHLQQLIGRLSNANQVCRSIDLCYQVGQVHLLGGHKCTFGPTYWCYTAAHADACKASEFCKTKVWKAVEQCVH